jgi:hypothetical protein
VAAGAAELRVAQDPLQHRPRRLVPREGRRAAARLPEERISSDSAVDARALILARRCGRVGDAADQPASNDRAARAEPTALAAVTKPRHHPLQTHKYTATTWN